MMSGALTPARLALLFVLVCSICDASSIKSRLPGASHILASRVGTDGTSHRRHRQLRQSADYDYANDDSDYANPNSDYQPLTPDYEPPPDYQPSPSPDYSSPSPSPGDYNESPSPSPGDYEDEDVSVIPTNVDTDPPCPSFEGTSCFSLGVSDPPSPGDPIVQVASDLATEVYEAGDAAQYAKEALGATDVRPVIDTATSTEALVAIGPSAIMVAFKGTEESEDWDTNYNTDLVSVDFGSDGSGGVHTGFYNAAESIYNQIKSILEEVNPNNEKYVYFTGHSLGSALAMVTAALVQADQTNEQTIDAVYSYGGPRVGDSDWVVAYNALGLGDKTLRFVNYKDPVPLLPPASTGYSHVGRSIILPLNGATCIEEGKDEYDVCEADASFFDFLGALGNNLVCVGLGSPLVAGFCSAAAADAASGNVPSNYVNLICTMSDDILLAGSPCCLLLEGAANGLDTIKAYHDIDAYNVVVYHGCAGSCAAQQYQQCGVGWTDENQAEYNQGLDQLVDPALSDSSAQTLQSIIAGTGTSSSSSPSTSTLPPPGNTASTQSMAALVVAGLAAVAVQVLAA